MDFVMKEKAYSVGLSLLPLYSTKTGIEVDQEAATLSCF
jgi:hypothetical protein